jgi:E3 ubiquitin-protein ligase SHPRH
LIAELEAAIQQHLEKEEALKKQDLPTEDDSTELDKLNEAPGSIEKGKGREKSPTPASDSSEGALLNEELTNRRRAFQHRLREVRIVQHRIKFLQGDVCHVLGDQQVALENEAYSTADQIRRDLLKGTSYTVMSISMTKHCICRR